MEQIHSSLTLSAHYFLVDVVNEAAKRLRYSLSQCTEKFDISYAQGRLLLYLFEEDGQTQKRLSKKLSIEPATAVRTLDRLERDGLIRRQRNTADRRAYNIYLTEEGKNLSQQLLLVYQKFDGKLLTNKPPIHHALNNLYKMISQEHFFDDDKDDLLSCQKAKELLQKDT